MFKRLAEICSPSRLYCIVGSTNSTDALDELVHMNNGNYETKTGFIKNGECIGDHEICRKCGKCRIEKAKEGFGKYMQTVRCSCDGHLDTCLRISKKHKDSTFSIWDMNFLDSENSSKCNYFISDTCPCYAEHQLSIWNGGAE